MKLRQENRYVDAIGFSMASHFERLEDAGIVDAVFVPTVNEWDGFKSLQLNLKAIRPGQKP